MTNLDNNNPSIDLFPELDQLQEKLKQRIESRNRVLKIIAEGNLKDGLAEADSQNVELFPQDLSLSFLRGQVKFVQELKKQADEYETKLKQVAQLEEDNNLFARQATVTRLIMQDILLQADTALLELDESRLTSLLNSVPSVTTGSSPNDETSATTDVGEDMPSKTVGLPDPHLTEWLKQLETDRDLLRKWLSFYRTQSPIQTYSNDYNQPTQINTETWQDLQAWKKALLEKQTSLDYTQYQKLKTVCERYPDSRLLGKYKSLHFAFASTTNQHQDISSFDEFLKAYSETESSTAHLVRKFEFFQDELRKTFEQQKLLYKVVTLTFIATWPRWIEQSDQIEKVLKEIDRLTSMNQPTQVQENKFPTMKLVSHLDNLLLTAGSVAVYRWHKKYGPTLGNILSRYSSWEKPIAKINEKAYEKSKQGHDILLEIKSPTTGFDMPQLHELNKRPS